MASSYPEAAAQIAAGGFSMVDIKFTDLSGRWRHITLPAAAFTEEVCTEGVAFDGSSVGFQSVHAGDMVLFPDFRTAFVDPFCAAPTLSFIAAVHEADTRQPFAWDPRRIATRAAAWIREVGIADRSLWGPEYEFYVFDRVAFDNRVNGAMYKVESREADWGSARGGHGHLIPLHGGYHAIPPRDQLHDLRSTIVLRLQAMGVDVKYHHHEVGGPGQCEIETPMEELLAAADAGQIVKYAVRMCAHQAGQTATFMPKPLFGEAGNGMHFHQQLWRNGTNLFHDPAGYGALSQEALWYIGGLLHHGSALLALTNPSTNSYRRLVPGFEAPVSAFFSIGNRSAAIRVPKYANGPDSARMEFRPPDATCNIYLAMAAQLMAGADGIRRKIDPRTQGYGPIEADLTAMSLEERSRIRSLPTSLREALDALAADHGFLLEGGVFPGDLIDAWIRARQEDFLGVRYRPHPYEVALYFDC